MLSERRIVVVSKRKDIVISLSTKHSFHDLCDFILPGQIKMLAHPQRKTIKPYTARGRTSLYRSSIPIKGEIIEPILAKADAVLKAVVRMEVG